MTRRALLLMPPIKATLVAESLEAMEVDVVEVATANKAATEAEAETAAWFTPDKWQPMQPQTSREVRHPCLHCAAHSRLCCLYDAALAGESLGYILRPPQRHHTVWR